MIQLIVRFILAIFVAMASSLAHATNDVALITALHGKVARISIAGPGNLEAFVKLKEGDVLKLDKGSGIRLVYFESGRQESWTGEGKLEIAVTESKGSGLSAPEVKVLPAILVKQIAKTPALDSQGRAGVTRLRAIGSATTVAKLEADYERMRAESGGKDLNAEIYLLAGLFELRELDRVEAVINELQVSQKDNMEAMFLVSLYRKALKSARIVRQN